MDADDHEPESQALRNSRDKHDLLMWRKSHHKIQESWKS